MNHEKIEDYIDGLLTGEELVEFEQQLAQDSELRELVALHRKVGAIIQKRENTDTTALLANLKAAELAERQSDKSDKGRVISFKKLVPILAAACALIVFAVYLFRPVEDLYSLPTMRSEVVRGQEAEHHYEDAVAAFNSGDYTKAKAILTALIEQDDSRVHYQYYAALTAIGLEEWSSAITGLEPIALGESVFADEAKYYLAIAYHEAGQRDKALSLLQKIPSDGKLGDKAEKLLKKLR